MCDRLYNKQIKAIEDQLMSKRLRSEPAQFTKLLKIDINHLHYQMHITRQAGNEANQDQLKSLQS